MSHTHDQPMTVEAMLKQEFWEALYERDDQIWSGNVNVNLRTEVEGLGFDPAGTMHVIVISPYTTPAYATGTNNPKPFLSDNYSIDGDDWNPGGSLRHYTRTSTPLRNQLCTHRK